MHTLRIFFFRLLDPPEWACRRVCNVEETHPDTFVTFLLNGICIFQHGNFGLYTRYRSDVKSLYICMISATVAGSPGAILSFTSGGVSGS